MINQWEAAEAAQETISKDVVKAAEAISARKGHQITWAEAGLYFRAKVGEVTADTTEGSESLSINVEEVESKPVGDGQEWSPWDGPAGSLGFAQSELTVNVPASGIGKINVRGTAYGPSRIEIS